MHRRRVAQFVAREYNATVACFDPTLSEDRFLDLSGKQAQLRFWPFGVGASDGVLAFYQHEGKWPSLTITPNLPGYLKEPALQAPILRLQTLHFISGWVEVDILKMDVEGAEFGAGVHTVAESSGRARGAGRAAASLRLRTGARAGAC